MNRYPFLLLLRARRAVLATALVAALAIVATPVVVAANPGDTVLARRGDIVVTRADFDAEIERIPADKRAEFTASTRRNLQMLQRILTTRELAVEAKARKLDANLPAGPRSGVEEDKLLAAALLAEVEAAAARDFDARRADFERAARESYTIDRARFAIPETVTLTHVVFAIQGGDADAAKKRADDAYAKIRAGTDIGALAATISDDVARRESRGRIGPLARTDLEAPLANAAFGLKNVGDVSELVRTRAGWHIVRLDGRTPAVPRSFDEAKDQIMGELRARHVAEAKSELMRGLAAGKPVVTDDAAIDTLKTPFVPPHTDTPVPAAKN